MLDHDENPISTECRDLCLQMIIKLFVRIRGFSHTKDIWKRHLAQQHFEKKPKSTEENTEEKGRGKPTELFVLILTDLLVTCCIKGTRKI